MTYTESNKHSIQTKALLVLSGLLASSIGGSLLLDPVAFEASAGIALEPTADLLSEMRAPGGALLVAGAVIGVGGFVPKLSEASLWTAVLLYLSYGVSRFIGFALDGAPSSAMLTVAIVEVTVGALNAFTLRARRPRAAPPVTLAA